MKAETGDTVIFYISAAIIAITQGYCLYLWQRAEERALTAEAELEITKMALRHAEAVILEREP